MEPVVEPADLSPPPYDPENPRTWPAPEGPELSSPVAMPIDTAQYPIHLRDNFNDWFYLKPIPNVYGVPAHYYAYSGYFVHNNVEYHATLIYYKSKKTISVSLGYLSNQRMLYHCHWESINFFRGSYTWTITPTASLKKQRPITVTVIKGGLPGMNL